MGQLEDKVNAYKELGSRIEELTAQKKKLTQEILELIPKEEDIIDISQYRVKRMVLFSIKTSLETARTFGAVKMEEIVDKKEIKKLLAQGVFIPDVTETHFIQVSKSKKALAEDGENDERDVK